jgi:hypothetical protein
MAVLAAKKIHKEFFMKKSMHIVCTVVVLVCLVFCLTGCGSSAKSLAQETYKVMTTEGYSSPKLSELNKKVYALSPEDQAVYTAELTRLLQAGVGQ